MMVGIKKEEWILRIGVFGAFLGHGAFALMGKQSWIPYITAVGISDTAAQTLLPLIGMLDVVVAVLALFWPLRIILSGRRSGDFSPPSFGRLRETLSGILSSARQTGQPRLRCL